MGIALAFLRRLTPAPSDAYRHIMCPADDSAHFPWKTCRLEFFLQRTCADIHKHRPCDKPSSTNEHTLFVLAWRRLAVRWKSLRTIRARSDLSQLCLKVRLNSQIVYHFLHPCHHYFSPSFPSAYYPSRHIGCFNLASAESGPGYDKPPRWSTGPRNDCWSCQPGFCLP